MRRSIWGGSLVAALIVGALGGTVLTSNASDPAGAAASRCSRASLHGSYAVRFDGQSAALGKFASVSLWRFNGKGRMSASETYNSEKTGPQKRRIAGRYSVKRNCRFDLRFGSSLVRGHEADGVCILMAKGRQFICLDNENGWVTTGTGTKL